MAVKVSASPLLNRPEQPLTFQACRLSPLGPTLRVLAKVPLTKMALMVPPTVPRVVELGPATVALHPEPLMLAMMLLIVTVVLVVIESQDWALSSQGWPAEADVVIVKVRPPGPVQVSIVTDGNDPMPAGRS